MGNYKLAIDDFEEAIKYDSELSEGYYRSGLCKYCSRRYKEAIDDFQTALEKQEKQTKQDTSTKPNPGIENGLAQCYHSLKDYEKAMDYYLSALEMDSKNTVFLLNRA